MNLILYRRKRREQRRLKYDKSRWKNCQVEQTLWPVPPPLSRSMYYGLAAPKLCLAERRRGQTSRTSQTSRAGGQIMCKYIKMNDLQSKWLSGQPGSVKLNQASCNKTAALPFPLLKLVCKSNKG